MKPTKTVFDGEKFVEISDAERPQFVAAYHARQEKRAASRGYQPQARAQPIEEMRYRAAKSRSDSRPPRCWPTTPAQLAPTTVPQSAIETVRPSVAGVNEN